LDSLSTNVFKVKEVTNTVKAIERDNKVKVFQLPSLITPVSLFGKRIRFVFV
jgi:lysophospholipase